MMRKNVSVAFMALALALSPAGSLTPVAAARNRWFASTGSCSGIGGQQMVVQADTGPSVGVDLTSVPQDEYAGLGVRDRVAVIGMVSPDGRRVIGTSIVRSARAR